MACIQYEYWESRSRFKSVIFISNFTRSDSSKISYESLKTKAVNWFVKPGRHPVHLVLPQDTLCQPDQKHRSSRLRCWNYQVDQGVTTLPEKWNAKNISMYIRVEQWQETPLSKWSPLISYWTSISEADIYKPPQTKKKSFGLYLTGDQNLELMYRNYQRVHPGISRGMLQWDQNWRLKIPKIPQIHSNI